MGFITPFDNMQYIAGVDSAFLYNIPLKAKIDVDILKKNISVTVKPSRNRRMKVLQSSMQPYTSAHDILNVIPVLEDTSTKPILTGPVKQVSILYDDVHILVGSGAVYTRWYSTICRAETCLFL
jgi:hypothetical protein